MPALDRQRTAQARDRLFDHHQAVGVGTLEQRRLAAVELKPVARLEVGQVRTRLELGTEEGLLGVESIALRNRYSAALRAAWQELPTNDDSLTRWGCH